MRDNASRLGASDTGTPLMILAFVVIGGFMYWLNGQAAAERALAVVEDTPTVDETAGAPTLGLRELELAGDSLIGTEVRIENVEVASMLGTQGFWLSVEMGNPYLASMGMEVRDSGTAVNVGDVITVAGVVTQMNDSTLTAWTDAATIDDNDRLVAEFAIHYLELRAVTMVTSASMDAN